MDLLSSEPLAHPTLIISAALLTYFLYALFKWPRNNTSGYPLPPGPKPLPLVGNAFDLPNSYHWLTYAEWAKEYGNVIYASAFGTPMVILNSKESVMELFEKRSAIYSDRARVPMLYELVGWGDWAMPFIRYGDKWRRYRKVFHQYFSSVASENYHAAHTLETRRMLKRMLEAPEKFSHHMRHLAAATIMRITYGIDVTDPNDEYIHNAEAAMDAVAKAGIPGSFLVDIFPSLRYLPAWLPGAAFQKRAQRWRKAAEKHINAPYDAVIKAMRANDTRISPSISSDLIVWVNSTGSLEDDVTARHVTAVAYAGGSDTTTSTFSSFFMAMALFPEVQKKAQVELDSILDCTRLPEFSDKASLPYIEAMVKEIQRWQPVLPLANAHRSIKEDVYNGYCIPEGTTVLANVWAILHDEKIYPDPEAFNPDRFLKDGKLDPVLDPGKFAFGFGRRICPGRHMSDNSAFIAMASILACFNIEHAKDASGSAIPIEVKMSPGLLSFPKPFRCSVTPRNPSIPSLIIEGVKEVSE